MATALDPQDPRCPECDGPISATATYCMHCYTHFETPDTAETTSTGEQVVGRLTDSSAASTNADALLAPDGLLDDSLTVTVGVVAGLVVAVLTFVTALLLTRSLWSLLLVAVVWVGVTVGLARQRTVHRAVRGGCYAVAFGLVALPTVALGPSMTGGTFAGQVFLFVVGELFFGLVALVLVAVGYVVGRKTRRSEG